MMMETKYMNKYEAEFDWTILIEKEYCKIYIEESEILSDTHFVVKKGTTFKSITVFLDFEYEEKYTLSFDKEINRTLKYGIQNYKLNNLFIESNAWKSPLKMIEIFRDINCLNFLSISTFFDKNEYKYIENLDIKILQLRMFDVLDIDLSAFKNLEKCYIILHKEHSTKQEIENSKDYIDKFTRSNPKIEVNFRVD